MLFKKPKTPRDHVSMLTGVGGEADNSKSLERGDEYAKR
jgi:hypothetical protein